MDPFDKNIINKYKSITKRYNEKFSSITDFTCWIEDLENGKLMQIDLSTGNILEEKDLKSENV